MIAAEDALTGKFFIAPNIKNNGVVEHRVRDSLYLVAYFLGAETPGERRLVPVEQMLEWMFFTDAYLMEAAWKRVVQ